MDPAITVLMAIQSSIVGVALWVLLALSWIPILVILPFDLLAKAVNWVGGYWIRHGYFPVVLLRRRVMGLSAWKESDDRLLGIKEKRSEETGKCAWCGAPTVVEEGSDDAV